MRPLSLKLQLTWILLSVLTVAVCTFAALAYAVLQRLEAAPPAEAQYAQPVPTREQVNAAVATLVASGRASEVYAFYAEEAGDPTRAMLYVSSALARGAPVDLVVSVGWWEGGHRTGVGVPNLNGSVDVYPMGLNSYTYKTYTLAELKRLEFNIAQGVEHLAGERAHWGVSWEAALASYNKGAPRGLDQTQVDYVSVLLRHEWELDRRFAARFPDALRW